MPLEFGFALAEMLSCFMLDRNSSISTKTSSLLLFESALAEMFFCIMPDKSSSISNKSSLSSLFGEFCVTVKFSL
jgi:hypothetical protein